MTAQVQPARREPPVIGCWCGGGEYAEQRIVRLGAHPEVAVCLDCARDLKRRAVARADEHRRSPQALARNEIAHVRRWVIERGWHRRGRLGVFLRWLDRILP